MSVAIASVSGTIWYSTLTIEEARAALSAGEPIRVWWFASHGQRFSETLWIPEDHVEYIRTESDD